MSLYRVLAIANFLAGVLNVVFCFVPPFWWPNAAVAVIAFGVAYGMHWIDMRERRVRYDPAD